MLVESLWVFGTNYYIFRKSDFQFIELANNSFLINYLPLSLFSRWTFPNLHHLKSKGWIKISKKIEFSSCQRSLKILIRFSNCFIEYIL